MATTPVAPASDSKGFVKRELNGASFLALEHTAHMALVVIVTGLVLAAIMASLSLWFGTSNDLVVMFGAMAGRAGASTEAVLTLGIVAALLVTVPLLVILDRRTRAEWHKRAGFASRLAYKLPVYLALGAIGVAIVGFKIQMLSTVLMSLALIGLKGADIGSLYIATFIPALIGAVVFSVAGWYVFNLAKGRDNGKMFSMLMAAVTAVLSVALFITAITIVHDPKLTPPAPQPNGGPYDSQYYDDLMKQYYQ